MVRLSLLVLTFFFGACAPTASKVQATPQAQALPAEGLASWYGPGFIGRRTASGEIFTAAELTAAHNTLPFNTRVRVTNLHNGRSVVVRINDRGPFKPGRIIDLSRAAAERLDMIRSGVVRVRLELAGDALWETAASSALSGFDIVSRFHPRGELLFLTSPMVAEPVLVRVVDTEMPAGTYADLLLSPEVYTLLGPLVSAAP